MIELRLFDNYQGDVDTMLIRGCSLTQNSEKTTRRWFVLSVWDVNGTICSSNKNKEVTPSLFSVNSWVNRLEKGNCSQIHRQSYRCKCNSIDFTSVPSPRPGRKPGTLCTRQQSPSKHRLPIAPQKPRPLQSKGTHYFKVSEQVTASDVTDWNRESAES